MTKEKQAVINNPHLRDSDTVKKVNIGKYFPMGGDGNPLGLPLYIVSLVEHKTKVEYNVCMQIFRYMYGIWDDYEKEMGREVEAARRENRMISHICKMLIHHASAEEIRNSLIQEFGLSEEEAGEEYQKAVE